MDNMKQIRWGLIVLSIFSLIAVFLPLLELDGLLFDYSISAWNIITQAFGEDAEVEGKLLLAVICGVLLILIAVVHILKLLGILGERVRDSRMYSLILSLAQLVCLAGFVGLIIGEGDMDDLELNILFSLLTPWLYIWFIATIVMVFLSLKLQETVNDYTPANVMLRPTTFFCTKCGKALSTQDVFFPSCGAPCKK